MMSKIPCCAGLSADASPSTRWSVTPRLPSLRRAWPFGWIASPCAIAATLTAALERLRLLVRRCRVLDNVDDHMKLWGLIFLITGPQMFLTAVSVSMLTLWGYDLSKIRPWTAVIIVGTWLALLIPTLRISGWRRPTSHLLGYVLILVTCYYILRSAMGLSHGMADAVQFLLMGALIGCVGIGSRHWPLFFGLSLFMIILASPVALASHQPSYNPWGPARIGACQGLSLLALSVSYLSPRRAARRKAG